MSHVSNTFTMSGLVPKRMLLDPLSLLCLTLPRQFKSNITNYEKTIMPFYKKFASEDHPYIVTETGLHYDAPVADKLAYLSQIIESSKAGKIVTKSITWSVICLSWARFD